MANNYKQYKKAKKEKNLADKGLVLGGTAAGIGGGITLGTKYIEKLTPKVEGGKLPTVSEIREAAKKGDYLVNPNKLTPEQLKKYKKTGAIVAAAGGTLAGVSAYKHYKAKKKLEELEGNDSKKK